jgi:hypothetical protein
MTADIRRAEARAALRVFKLKTLSPERVRWIAAGFKDSAGHLADWIAASARAGLERNAATAIYTNATPGTSKGQGNAGTFVIEACSRGYVYGRAQGAAIPIEHDASAPVGYSMPEIESHMGSPLPVDHVQAVGYARVAMRKLKHHDGLRFSQALHLGEAPDVMLKLWSEIAHENARRLQHEAPEQQKQKPVRRLALAAVSPVREDDDAPPS